MRVFHLLSSDHALSDLALGRIRLSRYGDLNDPFELLAASMDREDVRRAMQLWKQDFHNTKGLLCFSRAWENPVLWSHYASKHRGVALGFDLKDDFVHPMDYSLERLPITFKGNDPSLGLDEQWAGKLVRTKYEHWRYEDEVRMIMNLSEATLENGSYFYPFSDDLVLREVVLGALCPLPIASIRSLVETIHNPSVRVRKARLAFKEFRVVADQRYE